MALPMFARKAANAKKASRPRPPLEREIQHDIRKALGVKPGIVLMRNNVGHVKYYDERGSLVEFDYGLGEGSADLIGCMSGCACPHCGKPVPWGRFLAPEIKRPGENQRPKQVEWMHMIRYNGGMYDVLRSVADAEDFYTRALRGEL